MSRWLIMLLLVCGVARAQEARTLSCCSTHSVERVLEEYLDLHQALHDAEERRPSAECYALAGVLNAAGKDARLSAGDREEAATMLAEVDRVKDGHLDLVRAQFGAISAPMLRLARANQGGRHQVAEALCPGGPSWLQDGDTPQSPFSGSCTPVWR